MDKRLEWTPEEMKRTIKVLVREAFLNLATAEIHAKNLPDEEAVTLLRAAVESTRAADNKVRWWK